MKKLLKSMMVVMCAFTALAFAGCDALGASAPSYTNADLLTYDYAVLTKPVHGYGFVGINVGIRAESLVCSEVKSLKFELLNDANQVVSTIEAKMTATDIWGSNNALILSGSFVTDLSWHTTDGYWNQTGALLLSKPGTKVRATLITKSDKRDIKTHNIDATDWAELFA